MRTLSDRSLRAIYSEETGEVFLVLLEISDPSLSAPIRAVSNTVDIVHNYQKYSAFPFEIVLPVSDGQQLPSMTVRISNVSLELIGVIRNMKAPTMVVIKIILASEPDKILVQADGMEVRSVSVDDQVINFSIMIPATLASQYPSKRYSASEYPGLRR